MTATSILLEVDHPIEPVSIGVATTGGLILSGRCRVYGWSIKESTAAATAELDIWDGTTASGLEVFPVTLAINQSSREWFGPEGVLFTVGVFANVAAGSVVGSVFVRRLWR